MQFIRCEGTEELVVAMADEINSFLENNESVLWLVPGGSNILVATSVMAALPAEYLSNLTIILTDERYGAIGHPDSNFYQLHQAGFTERGATFVDLLYGGSFEETVSVANNAMEHLLVNTKHIIGFFGMGSDGHIAGILPGSPATNNDEKWVVGYDGGQYQRITLTPHALSYVQKAYVGAFGSEKEPELQKLHDQILPIAEQPAQILKHVPEVYIYNSQINSLGGKE